MNISNGWPILHNNHKFFLFHQLKQKHTYMCLKYHILNALTGGASWIFIDICKTQKRKKQNAKCFPWLSSANSNHFESFCDFLIRPQPRWQSRAKSCFAPFPPPPRPVYKKRSKNAGIPGGLRAEIRVLGATSEPGSALFSHQACWGRRTRAEDGRKVTQLLFVTLESGVRWTQRNLPLP